MNFRLHIDTAGLDRVEKEISKGLQPRHGKMFLYDIDRALVGSGHYKEQWSRLQSEWKPLTSGYLERKLEAGLSHKKWLLSGATLRGLSTSIPMQFPNVYIAGGSRLVKVVENNGYIASATWDMVYPAASGWPGKKKAPSKFGGNNLIRPLINKISPKARKAAESNMVLSVRSFFNRVFNQ